MIDQAVIQVSSGNGGSGSISGRREKFVPYGGPDGGDGGDGGDAHIAVDPNIRTLLSFRYKRMFRGGSGSDGLGRQKHGKRGQDVIVYVPEGTEIWLEERSPTLLADLASPLNRVLIAKGGRGGRGNIRFASPTNQYPLLAEEGEAGEELKLRLELKLLADVGIIGAPNAGKSSLLAAVCAARPKIAGYPFTTLEPVLGMVEHQAESFVMVDIPGLIEGAHKGVGLGHDFLRHVERTRVLVHVLDGSAEDPFSDYLAVRRELELFSEDLATKTEIVAINKIDVPEARERTGELKSKVTEAGWDPYFISALGREGLDSLMDGVLAMLGEAAADSKARVVQEKADEIPVLRPRPRTDPVKVVRKRGACVVAAPAAARIAAMIDPSNWAAKTQFYGHLRRIGVVKALEDAGISSGDTVRIGKVEWEWE